MKSFNYVITDEVGIHARPAGILVKEAKKYASTIMIVKGEKKADASRLMALMGLGVKCGDGSILQSKLIRSGFLKRIGKGGLPGKRPSFFVKLVERFMYRFEKQEV